MPERLAWWVAGPVLGLLVVGLFIVLNQPLGASGAYIQTAELARRRPRVAWRVWYFVGIVVGGFVAALLNGTFALRIGFEPLRNVWPAGLVVLVVFAGAVLLGIGARIAGGCTSGHGICGTSQRSPASFTVTATFMAVAIVVTFVLSLITGGRL